MWVGMGEWGWEGVGGEGTGEGGPRDEVEVEGWCRGGAEARGGGMCEGVRGWAGRGRRYGTLSLMDHQVSREKKDEAFIICGRYRALG